MTATPSAGQVWTSYLNQQGDIQAGFDREQTVRFYDTTLRDGEQTIGVVFPPAEKFDIACKLSEFGVGRIEAGFPRVSDEDSEAVRRILGAGLKSEIWGFSRAVQADLEALVELGVTQAVVEISTSDIKMQAYGFTRAKVLSRSLDSIKFARDHGMRVCFFPVDGTRSDLGFLHDVFLAAVEAGAEEIAVVDTVGAACPEAIEQLVRTVRGWVGPKVPIHFHGHNDFGLATAACIAAVRGGANWIQGTINGMGERAGNADIAEVALALTCLYNMRVDVDLTLARMISNVVREAGLYPLSPWKPVVGENLFVRESGAVASQFHMPAAIEPYSADLVSANRRLVLGKKSGLVSIELKGKELGVNIPEEKRAAVLAAVKQMATRSRRLVTDDEFRKIAERAI